MALVLERLGRLQRSHAILVLVLALVVVSLAVGPAVTTARASTVADKEPVEQSITVNNTEVPGQVVVTYRYATDADVRALAVWLPHPEATTVLDSRGFERKEDYYQWTERDASNPYLRVAIDLNRTTLSGNGAGVDPGSWAFLTRPAANTKYYTSEWHNATETPEITAAGPDRVAGGEGAIYVGNYTGYTREASTNETFHLIVPGEADTAAEPEAILSGLTTASATLQVGGTHDDVYAIAMPTTIRSKYSGITYGDTFWVRANETMRGPDNTWFHEYVHTRQRWDRRADFWFDEASAEYFALKLSLSQGDTEFDAAYRVTSDVDDEDAVLTDASTWDSEWTQYDKGMRVVAALDGRIKNRTNYTRSVSDVFRRLNGKSGNVTNAAVVVASANVTEDNATAAFVRKYTTTEAIPPAPEEPTAYAFLGEDSDSDGLTTAVERRYGTSPFAADTDQDGLHDAREIELGTNPTESDTDGDRLSDGREVQQSTDPLDPNSPKTTPTRTATPIEGEQAEQTPGVKTLALVLALFGLLAVGGVSGLLLVGAGVNAGVRRVSGRSLGWFDRRSPKRLTAVLLVSLLLALGVTYLLSIQG